jgi:ABC-type enterochelin transport system ATPase subunit
MLFMKDGTVVHDLHDLRQLNASMIHEVFDIRSEVMESEGRKLFFFNA